MTQVVKLILRMGRKKFGSRSVSRILYLCDHFSSPVIADGVKRPTHPTLPNHVDIPSWSGSLAGSAFSPRKGKSGAYLALHRVGFTAFHPSTFAEDSSLWPSKTSVSGGPDPSGSGHFPSGRPVWPLTSTLPCDVRTFLTSYHYNNQCDRPIGSQIVKEHITAQVSFLRHRSPTVLAHIVTRLQARQKLYLAEILPRRHTTMTAHRCRKNAPEQ